VGPVGVTYCSLPDAHVPQVAYAIGRKVGSAVVRNRLRRRLREVTRRLAPEMAPGAYLVTASREACSMRFEELTMTVSRAMGSACAAR
jgi:ribonuclease P protein component